MNNKQKSFIIGSNSFFNKFKDYKSKDLDELIILSHPLNISDKSVKVLNLKHGNKDIFFYWPLTKDEFIQETLNSSVPMKAGKFLVKEFADYIGMTIDDLKQLKPMFDNMDIHHTYEKIIYDAYIKNNDFYMTDEQLNKAYNIYKKYKKQ